MSELTKQHPCPICGGELEFVPHPDRPGRVRGFCPCNPLGPVVETNIPAAQEEPAPKQEPANKKEK